MQQRVESTKAPQEQEVQVDQKAEQYEMHIRLPKNTQVMIKTSAEIAYRLGLIQKPDLVDLMSLFIAWGIALLKQKWLEHFGYR